MKKDLPDLPEKLYSLKEAREMLGVGERTIHRYIHSGRLRATKIGYWKISNYDLRVFLTQNANIREALDKKATRIYLKPSDIAKAKKTKKKK
ncbi:MAG: helix-turn-helix domain-containing protein [bacterium]|nr:helix-turn-helix domain-containing protein [bacterium]